MRRTMFFAAIVALVLAVALPATAAPMGKDRPFFGRASGEAVFDLSNPRNCSYPDPYYQITTFTHLAGVAAQMGTLRVDSSHCPTPTDTTLGEMTLTAANGDRLTATYGGPTQIDETFTHVSVEGLITVTGGTGRFAGATGTIHYEGVVTITDPQALSWPMVETFEGTISY
jgi:hypothetical protein